MTNMTARAIDRNVNTVKPVFSRLKNSGINETSMPIESRWRNILDNVETSTMLPGT